MGTVDATLVGMETLTDVLFVAEQTVGRAVVEIFPDKLDGLEFGRIAGKVLDMKPRKPFPKRARLALLGRQPIPQQDDRAEQRTQKDPHGVDEIGGVEIVLLE